MAGVVEHPPARADSATNFTNLPALPEDRCRRVGMAHIASKER
jgi:hypothetical protein